MYIFSTALYCIAMAHSTEITRHTSVDGCIRLINETLESVKSEYEDVSEDELFTDLAASMLVGAKRETAEEVCRTQIGFVPQSLIQIWKLREKADAERILKNQRARYERDKAKRIAERAAAEETAAAAEKAAVKARTCAVCWTVRTPAGTCNC